MLSLSSPKYKEIRMDKSIGKTKNVGFQFGLQKTFSISEEDAWDFMFSDAGLKIWIGELKSDFSLGENYETKNGIEGIIRVLKHNSHIRLSWKMSDWTNTSTVQMRVIGKGKNRTLISFHQEKLLDFNQRAEMKEYWNEKMKKLTKEVEACFSKRQE